MCRLVTDRNRKLLRQFSLIDEKSGRQQDPSRATRDQFRVKGVLCVLMLCLKDVTPLVIRITIGAMSSFD